MINQQKLLASLSHQRMAQVVALMAGFLLLFAVYQKGKLFFVGPMEREAKPTVSLAIRHLPAISSMHLFGNYAAIEANLLPKTDLDLTLEGILYGGPVAQAIIAAPGHKAKVYKIEEAVPGGATLQKILPKGAVLKQNGRLEWLPLQFVPLHFAPVPKVENLTVAPD